MKEMRRFKVCVEAWPECESGEYNPACCRWPKSCSCLGWVDEYTSNEELEPAAEEKPRTRPDWDTYFLSICIAVSQRADCRRAKHGAVIVQSKRIVATGYNGSPAGSPASCLKGDCPRGLLTYEQLASLTGGYDNCIAVHAEANAIVHSNRGDCVDATIYVTGKPCPGCEKLIRASGIRRVVWPTGSFWV